MTNIFLSYARSDDEPFVRRLQADLTAAGFDVWFDKNDLRSRGLTFHHEIRNAIDACDRLVLIVGPRSAQSEYVRQEWQYAWFDKATVVTPVLRKSISDLPREDDYRLIPDELKLLHCEDFRDDAQYRDQLTKLIASLSAPPPRLGQLIGVPSLPQHYLFRAKSHTELRAAVRAGLDSTAPLGGTAAHQKLAGIIGRQRMGGMAGMGGIGKSVLACLLAHDRFIREAFPDGIVWVALGSLPTLSDLMQRVYRALGGEGVIQNEHEGKTALQKLLADKSVLLILDDAWRKTDVEAFDVLGPTCRALITTRDAQLVTSLGGTPHLVELLSEDEALRLMAVTSGEEISELPPEASAVIQQCGRLPLAVVLAGGMVAGGMPWQSLLTAFDRHKLEFFQDDQRDNQHHDLLRTIEVSVQSLEPEEQLRFVELGVFPEDEAVPEAAVTTLWGHTGQLDDLDTQTLLMKLKHRSLVQLSQPTASSVGRVALHDLLHDYCLRRADHDLGSEAALHERLLAAYRAKCANGWFTGANDGYLHGHLRSHLLAVGRVDELVDLLTDLRWIQAKAQAGLVFELAADYASLQGVLPEFQADRQEEEQRVTVLCQYGEDLIAYARARGNGVPLPKPPSTRHARTASPENSSAAPPTQAERVRAVSVFVATHSHVLNQLPEETIVVARNSACGGIVVEQAELLADALLRTWMARDPRPPVPEDRPQCQRTLLGHAEEVTSVAITPDGRRAVSASYDQTLKVWNLENGLEEKNLQGHTGPVSSVAITPDGRHAISASGDKTLRMWDLGSGREEKTLHWHTNWVLCVAITPDGRRAVSAAESSFKVWDLDNGYEEKIGHIDGARYVVITPDGRRAVSASYYQTLTVWDLESGCVEKTLQGHTGCVWSVAITPDGHRAVSASADETLNVWDVESGAKVWTLRGHSTGVKSVAITPDGRRAISGSQDGTLKVWDLGSGREEKTFQGHPLSDVTSVAITPDGRRAISASGDKTIRIWDLEGGEAEKTRQGHGADVTSVAITPDGRRAVSTSLDKSLKIWDLHGCCEEQTLPGHTVEECVAISPDGGRAVSAGGDEKLRVWDLENGRKEMTLQGHTDKVHSVAITPDGRRAVSASGDHTLKVWELERGRAEAILQGHAGSVWSVAITPDGRRAVSASGDGTLRIWDLESGREEKTLQGHLSQGFVAITPDGRRAVTVGGVNKLTIWDLEQGREEWTVQAHSEFVVSVAITPDGRRAVSAGWDKTLKVWNLDNGACLATSWLGTPASAVAAFGAGRIVCGARDGQVHFLTIRN